MLTLSPAGYHSSCDTNLACHDHGYFASCVETEFISINLFFLKFVAFDGVKNVCFGVWNFAWTWFAGFCFVVRYFGFPAYPMLDGFWPRYSIFERSIAIYPFSLWFQCWPSFYFSPVYSSLVCSKSPHCQPNRPLGPELVNSNWPFHPATESPLSHTISECPLVFYFVFGQRWPKSYRSIRYFHRWDRMQELRTEGWKAGKKAGTFDPEADVDCGANRSYQGQYYIHMGHATFKLTPCTPLLTCTNFYPVRST